MKSHNDALDVAHDLATSILKVARNAEIERQPDDGVVARAREAELFGLLSPRRFGGAELDIDTFLDVGLVLGEADASHAWVLNFYIEHVWMFTQFPSSFQGQIFDGRSYVLAPAVLSPTGSASIEKGGYRLSGRWQWGTGIVHADWIIAGASVATVDGPIPMFFALPREKASVEDTWFMDGMCGTGSRDIIIDNVFIEEDRAVSVPDMLSGQSEGARAHTGALYRTPMAPILSLAAAMPVLGQARRAVNEFADQLHGRYDLMTLEKQATRNSRQIRLAEADAEARSAEAFVRQVVAEVMTSRERASESDRVRWTASIAFAVRRAQHAINTLCEVGGASAHKLDNPLQRARRDVNAIACHMVFDTDERFRAQGRALLGLAPESTWH